MRVTCSVQTLRWFACVSASELSVDFNAEGAGPPPECNSIELQLCVGVSESGSVAAVMDFVNGCEC